MKEKIYISMSISFPSFFTYFNNAIHLKTTNGYSETRDFLKAL